MHGDTAEHSLSVGQLWGQVEKQSRLHAHPWSLPGTWVTRLLPPGCEVGSLEAAPGQDPA